MLMSGNDWTNCWGEVFEIYRKEGPGDVKSGDTVGFYYPRQGGTWLGCGGSNCAKANCPGYPTTHDGFRDQASWHNCWGEVFKIFARGKPTGSIINSQDEIAIYYLRDNLWVAQPDNRDSLKFPCLGTDLPPALATYDGCFAETFRIFVRN